MKTKLLPHVASLAGILFVTTHALAADVTAYDSVVSLATNRTRHYTFKDSSSGESIIVSLNMSPFSSGAGKSFSLRSAGTRVAIGTGVPDEDLIDYMEGVDFEASLAFASSGVTPGSVRFRISGLGLRDRLLNPTLRWVSSATAPPPFTVPGEMLYPLDALPASLYKTNYTAELRHDVATGAGYFYQLSDVVVPAGQGLKLNATFDTTNAQPHANSWLTTYAGRYARIYTNEAARSKGISSTTWRNPSNTLAQALPAYSGVQEIHSSTDWVYVRSTGLGSYVMGPWPDPAPGKRFPNVPVNQKSLGRFPRAPSIPITKPYSPASTIGYFVDGVSMFNSWSGYFWDGTKDTQGPSPGGYGAYWNADAYITEGVTFDAGLGHPESRGRHHYHANPIALRYLLGDHVDFDPVTRTYIESPIPVTKHSPILGWVNDGFPIYGPYAYSNPLDPASGLRLMRSGYVKRDGLYGTDNLTLPPTPPATSQRTTRPLWAQRLFAPCLGLPPCIPPASSTGPAVTSPAGSYPLGHYMEDYDYIGDHGYTQGADFDLDEFNGRWCVTPEFPAGTYAYFVAIDPSGIPVFPYNIGRGYYGEPTGSNVTNITEAVTTHFLGEIDAPLILDTPTVGAGSVTLTWSAAEGGHYRVESSTNSSTWTVLTTDARANQITGSYTNIMSNPAEFYRVARWTFDWFDPVLDIVAPGGSASRGTTVIVTVTLPPAPPPPPPAEVPAIVTLGGMVFGMGLSRPDPTRVAAIFEIPPTMPAGAKDIYVEFFGGPIYTLTGALTIK